MKGRSNTSWVGQSVPRREDAPLLSGRARFTDDVTLPRMGHVAVLPSPYAHAKILKVDTSAAKALPGVYCILTGAEALAYCGPLPTFSTAPIEQHCIAVEKVRHVGEPVAAVLAESRYVAEDAVGLIEVEYEPLPAVTDAASGIAADGNALLHPQLGTNVAAHRHFKWGPVDEVFSSAHHIVRRRFRWPRVGPQPMETCAAVADWDASRRKFTIYSTMSTASIVGASIANTLGLEQRQINFVTVHVGGSFGGKNSRTHVTCIAAALSRAAGRPAKYVEDRLEHMSNGNQHASDREYDAALAIDREGNFIGLRLTMTDDYGAYLSTNLGSHGNALAQATGPYRIRALEYEVTAVLTNKTQQSPYRGFGGEVGNFVIERLVDAAAIELGRDRLDLRRQNFIGKEEFPYRLPHGNLYDSGDYHAVLDEALRLANLTGLAEMRAEARARDRRLGVGIATVNERSVMSITELWMLDDKPPRPISSTPESIRLSIDSMGGIQAVIFAPHWGNSPETMVVQLVAENLATTPDRVSVVYGDTDGGLMSLGPAGSRYTVMIAGAVAGASRALKRKMGAMAAHLLGATSDRLVFYNGSVYVDTEPSRSLTYAELASAARYMRLSFPQGEDFQSGLTADFTYDHPKATLPNEDRSDLGIFYPIVGHACHIAIIEVDEATGGVSFVRYIAVHDAGTIVNPKLVDGQIRGGIAQGIGTALYEQYHYNEEGQLLTGSLADYLVPTASEIPDMIIGHIETPSPYTEFGIKGCGEGGRLASIPAVASAIDDAFSDEGIFVDTLPVTPPVLLDLRRKSEQARAERG
ncbi:xanthine dehydrogenase family protein molybdopterin-binding subunit [Bradyrhizobium tunisiense]|uniref:xanthine dehydrogenase family protein molybdopterin-binding subunit n=1 Tax=Bradyrhizobium tunisiense TaxID=3278709 RepID=UPI0035D7B4F4